MSLSRGRLPSDRTEASASMAYDFRRNTWSDTLTTLWDLRADFLPKVVPSAFEAGRVSKAGAAATGLPVGVPQSTEQSCLAGRRHTPTLRQSSPPANHPGPDAFACVGRQRGIQVGSDRLKPFWEVFQ